MSKNIGHLSGRKGLENNLFEEMGNLAAKTGTPSVEDLKKLADEFLLGDAITFGASTFYDFMKPENKGKKAYVCNGTACMCAGTQDNLRVELEKHLDANEIGHMTCLGRCYENSAFHYNGKNYSALSPEDIEKIIREGEKPEAARYHVEHIGTPALTAPFDGMDKFGMVVNKLFALGPENVLDEITKSNIRGRGGAGFPMGFKLKSCRDTPSDIRYIVCNADEGDPGAYSDRYLLEERPFSVLFGMLAAGYAVGASWGVLYIRAEYPEAVDIVQDAIDKMTGAGLAGSNILGSGFDFHFKIIRAQGAYICGEETALLSSIEGQRPEVRIRPPYPTQEGLFNKPTVVNNVETLAALYYIIDMGGEEYRKLGTERSSGTKLISLDSFFNRPGMYEVPMGTPLRIVVDELGKGFRTEVKALHIGGPLGGLVPVHKIDDLTIDFESFNNNGFLLGHASVVCVPADFPMVKYIEHLFAFTAAESCGKCFPCRLGSVRGEELLVKAQNESYKIDKQLFDDLLDALEQGSLCALGGGLPLPVKNALQYFEDELKQYFA